MKTLTRLAYFLAAVLGTSCAFAEDAPTPMMPAPAAAVVGDVVPPPSGVIPPGALPADAKPTAYEGLSPEEREALASLSALERETQLMKAKVELMEQKAKYEEVSSKIQRGIDERSAPKSPEKALDSASNPVSSAYDAHIAPDEKALAEMTLVSVYGTGANLEGELFYRGGRMKVVKGARLPGDWVVSSIEPTRLIASKGARRFEVVIGSPQTGSTSSVNKIR